MQNFFIKVCNAVLAVSLICTYNSVVNDRKEQEEITKQEMKAQQEALDAAAKAEESEAANQNTTSPYADGVYTGEAQGYGGTVEMEVTISDGVISDIVVVSAEKEDAAYFEAAQAVIDEILEDQSTEVDVVSGATFSSNGILGAVEEALGKAEQQ